MLLAATALAAATPQVPGAPQPTSFKVLAGFHLPDAIFKAKPGHVLAFVPGIHPPAGRQGGGPHRVHAARQIHNRLVTEFMLMRTQNTCCFGIPPELHEVVEVLKIDTPTKVLMDTPVTVVGRLHVRTLGRHLPLLHLPDGRGEGHGRIAPLPHPALHPRTSGGLGEGGGWFCLNLKL